MEVKPGYKQTEVGAERGDWRDCDISDLCGLQRGFDITEATRKAGDVPVYSSSGLSYFHNEAKLKPPAVITGRKGILGKVFFVEEPCWPHDTTLWVKDFKGNDPSFVYRFLIQFRLERFDAATAVPTLNRNNLVGIPIKLPPLPEQRTIAGALRNVDALIGALDQFIAKKRDLKQAAMQQLLTGHQRLPGFHGKWETKAIGDHIDLLTGFPFPSNQYSETGVRLLRGSNVKRGETDWAEDIVQYWPSITAEIERYQLQSGDLVIAMDGSLVGRSYARLKSTDLPAVLLQRVARIRSKTIDIGFLTQVVGSEWFIKYCDSVKTVTAIPHISSADIRTFDMPLPPTIDEQTAIAEVLSDMDAELAALTQRRDKTRALKQGMMQELLTGRTRLI